ncbi:MAG: hypothetical protein CMJ50_08955 [Planctomycetaceae bacterium]|nr:hypothetical protein [Planctomycetaceae bacterium]
MGDEMKAETLGTTTKRWQAVCKECQRKGLDGSFGYPDSWTQKTLRRGGTRSNRCPACRLAHGRDAALMAVPYIDVATIGVVQDPSNPTGPLGGLGPLPIAHKREEAASADLAKYDFGLTDAHMRQLLEELRENQVAVVIAGTGSGKSTFLPFRLLYPPDKDGRHLADRGQIIVTQPRRCAAIDIAAFVASLADPRVAAVLEGTEGEAREKAIEQLSRMGYFGVGSEVGYRVSGEHAFDANCRLVYVTDGSLLAWLRDGKLDAFGTIVIDEAHERSQNIDFILGYLRDALPRHPRLRVIIVSATIDGDFFVNFFGGSDKGSKLEVDAKKVWGYGEPLWPMMDIADLLSTERAKDWQKPGPNNENLETLTRKYEQFRLPEDEWEKCDSSLITDKKSRNNWRTAIPALMAKQIISIVKGTDSGDILAFLPTGKLIDETYDQVTEQLEKLSETSAEAKGKVDKTTIYKLLASAPKEEQESARGEKADPSCRRVILSTNIAETSLTIDGITFVVDSGLILQTTWDVATASKGFPTVFHSQDGIRQRWGRVGRKAPGWVFPLYTEEMYNGMPPHTPPASIRENSEQSVLKAVGCGIADPCSFMFPAAFSTGDDAYSETAATFREELKRAYASHQQRGALDEQGDLTVLGLEIEPYIGSMTEATAIMLADQLACAIEAITAMKLLQGGSSLIGNQPKNNLFEFNWKWDADARDRARRYLLALRAGCIDDLDVVLKVYAAWERAVDDQSLAKKREDRPRAWAEKHFVSHAVLKAAKAARKDALRTLSFNKKSSELRPVLPELAPRVRAVFSYALGDLIYERTDSGSFRPADACSEGQSLDHSGIDLDGLVPPPRTDRVIAFRRFSARGFPALSNLVECVEWGLPKASKAARPWSGFVRKVALRLRDSDGQIIGPSHHDHWALWDEYPIGSYVRCRFRHDGEARLMQRIEILKDGPDEHPIASSESEDGETATDDAIISDDTEDGGLASLARGAVIDSNQEPQYEEKGDAEAREKENAVVRKSPQKDARPADALSSELQSPNQNENANPWVRVNSAGGRDLPLETGIVQVVAFEGNGEDRRVLVEPVAPPTEAIEKLKKTAEKQGVVQIKVVEVVRGWGPSYIACREIETGVRVVLGHCDLSLNRFDNEFAEMVPADAVFEVTVTGFDASDWLLRATRIPQVLHAWGQIKPKSVRSKGKKAPAVPAHIRGTRGPNGDIVNIVVDGGEPTTGLVFRFTQRMDRLLQFNVIASREDAIQDAPLLLCVLPSDDQQSLKLPVDLDEIGEHQDLDKFFRVIDSIEWLENKGTVQSKRKPILSPVRDKLLKLSANRKWHEKVWDWWAQTNSLKPVATFKAQSGAEQDAWKKFQVGDMVNGTVNNVTDFGAFVEVAPGVSGLVHVSEMSWQRPNHPEDMLAVGQSATVKVISVDAAQQKIGLSMKALQTAPSRGPVPLSVGQVLQGRVSEIRDGLGVFVDIGRGRPGLVHISQIANAFVADIRDHVQEGAEVTVKVLDETSKGISLSMKDV